MHIYLDYNASTPIDPTVAAAMKPFLHGHFGNPSSGHWASVGAKAALEAARGHVAELLGCSQDEVVFTSGGSEANNLALKGAFLALRSKGDHIVTTRVEHPAILEPCRFLEGSVALNGHPTERLPNTLNVSFVGQVGTEILQRLETVTASTGSACHAGQVTLSPVLAAMGVAPEVGIGAVRFSLGRGTTREEIDLVLEGLEHHQQIHGRPDPN
jgi:cysteine sulfinate desulfinase/cysteine desulfurase-like protein